MAEKEPKHQYKSNHKSERMIRMAKALLKPSINNPIRIGKIVKSIFKKLALGTKGNWNIG